MTDDPFPIYKPVPIDLNTNPFGTRLEPVSGIKCTSVNEPLVSDIVMKCPNCDSDEVDRLCDEGIFIYGITSFAQTCICGEHMLIMIKE